MLVSIVCVVWSVTIGTLIMSVFRLIMDGWVIDGHLVNSHIDQIYIKYTVYLILWIECKCIK